ncbi:MAG: DNA mismatch repair protein MutS, partial [Alphaproteobacteria bacterium]
MTGRRRGSADGDLWRRATQDVTPIGGRAPRAGQAPAEAPAPPSAPPATPAAPPAPRRRTTRPPLEAGAAGDDDARSVERLKRGQLPVEARLD